MWIWARNNLDMVAQSLPDVADRDELAVAFVKKHRDTIMTAQAMLQQSPGARDLKQIHGLVPRAATVKTNDELAKVIAKHPPALFRLGVTFASGGGHALGVDTRGGELHVFDPNVGHFISEANNANRAARSAITPEEVAKRLLNFLNRKTFNKPVFGAPTLYVAYTRNT